MSRNGSTSAPHGFRTQAVRCLGHEFTEGLPSPCVLSAKRRAGVRHEVGAGGEAL